MSDFHITMQSKGGAGKSVVTYLLANFIKEKGYNPICYDTDPSNDTFAKYEDFGVERIEIFDDDKEVDKDAFEKLIYSIFEEADRPIIVDTGSSTFPALEKYFSDNNTPAIVAEEGHRFFIHTIIQGGSEMRYTITVLLDLLKNFGNSAYIVVWENPYPDKVESDDGRPFEEMEDIKKIYNELTADIKLPYYSDKSLERKNFTSMLKNRKTFQQQENDKNVPIFERKRIKKIHEEIYDLLNQVPEILPIKAKNNGKK